MADYFLGKEQSITEKYPKLASLECFDKKKYEPAKPYTAAAWKAICKYVVYRSDRYSPITQISDETQSMSMAFEKAYVPEDIAESIRRQDEDILFIHQMTVEFLMLVRDYKMQELISLRGIMRKIMLSSITPTMEMREGTKHDADHHVKMVKNIKEFEWMSDRATKLEEDVFGLHPEEGKDRGKNWSVAGSSEHRAKTGLYD